MPDFRFTVHDGTTEIWAKVETLDSLAVAKARAVDNASELLGKVDGAFWQDGRLQLDVSDANGLRLCTILIAGLEVPSPGTRLPLLH
ncbi:MAG: hypothetical protein EOO77_40065 [Oxalobacteraceae bacterium]|nr:MAG: hypothetical protein EOO77_40065 [Oxalobacteraceae bacterium]